MLTVKPNGPNRIDLELDGQLDSDDMAIALDALLKAAEGIENGTMLYRIHDFQLPTLAAIGVELSRLPALFGLIGKFKRCAVLADENWLKAIGELEGGLIPGLEIKGFDLNNEVIAEAWLAKT